MAWPLDKCRPTMWLTPYYKNQKHTKLWQPLPKNYVNIQYQREKVNVLEQ